MEGCILSHGIYVFVANNARMRFQFVYVYGAWRLLNKKNNTFKELCMCVSSYLFPLVKVTHSTSGQHVSSSLIGAGSVMLLV